MHETQIRFKAHPQSANAFKVWLFYNGFLKSINSDRIFLVLQAVMFFFPLKLSFEILQLLSIDAMALEIGLVFRRISEGPFF